MKGTPNPCQNYHRLAASFPSFACCASHSCLSMRRCPCSSTRSALPCPPRGLAVRGSAPLLLTGCDAVRVAAIRRNGYGITADYSEAYQAPTRRNIDNALALPPHRKNTEQLRLPSAATLKLTKFPKCCRQTTTGTLAKVTMASPGLTASFCQSHIPWRGGHTAARRWQQRK